MKDIIANALAALKGAGADKAQCWLTRTEKTEINLASGELSLMRTTFDTSLRMTALVGGRKGSLTVNQLDDLAGAAALAVEAARASQDDPANDIAPKEDGPEAFDDARSALDLDRLFSRFEEMRAGIASEFPKISILEAVCAYVSSESVTGNTNGSLISAKDAYCEFGVNFVAKDGGRSSSLNGAGFVGRTLDEPFLSLGNIRELLANSVRELDAAPLGEKFTGDVVLMPSVVGEVLGGYVGCFLSDRALISGSSLLKDKLGQAVAGDNVTVVSNPLDNSLCGYRLTGDGFYARDAVIIDGGILKSFGLGLYGANKTGLPRSANLCDRASLLPGDTPLAELIGGVKKGLLMGRFSGGAPNESGDLTGVAKNSFLIEDGKVTRPVQETMISGNLLEMMRSVAGISRETVSDGITRQPWARISGMSISG